MHVMISPQDRRVRFGSFPRAGTGNVKAQQCEKKNDYR